VEALLFKGSPLDEVVADMITESRQLRDENWLHLVAPKKEGHGMPCPYRISITGDSARQE